VINEILRVSGTISGDIQREKDHVGVMSSDIHKERGPSRVRGHFEMHRAKRPMHYMPLLCAASRRGHGDEHSVALQVAQ
jgi:hypothetical protein